MFREMRKQNRKTSDTEAIELLEKGEYGVLSTVDPNGYPYGIPLSYVYIDGSLYFHCALHGQKLDNIYSNEKVSFCVIGNTEIIPEKFTTKYESVIVFGEAFMVTGEEKEKGLLALVKKYSKDYMDKGKAYISSGKMMTVVFKITITHISGKRSN